MIGLHRETSTTPTRSVPKLHRLQEGVRQSLACRPVADPQKLQHRGRTDKTRPGTNLKFKYGGSGSAILLKGQLGEFSKTTVGVRQGCLLSPILLNLFLDFDDSFLGDEDCWEGRWSILACSWVAVETDS